MDKIKNNKLLLVLGLILTILIVSGGTFAYFQWQSSLEDITNVVVTVTDDITMTIDPAAVTKTGMRPTNNCGGSYGMQGTSTIIIDNQTGVLARPRFKLKIKITDSSENNITNTNSPMGNPYKYYIKYAVAETDGDCTSPLTTGRFNLNTETTDGSGWYDSPELTLDDADGFPAISDGTNSGVSFNASANRETTHTYKVWIWIDETYTAISTGNSITVDKLQDATITVSWSENSTVEQVRGDGTEGSGVTQLTGEAYAVYSADDTSLRFYRSETPITVGSTYNGRTVTAVYTGFEEEIYDHDDSDIDVEPYYVPWIDYANNITSVIFEDSIMPISVNWWFDGMSNCANLDVTNLNTSSVTSMWNLFEFVGYYATTFSITGLENWDTSNVTSMEAMFKRAGYNSTTWSIGDLSGWDVSNVTSMEAMFEDAGKSATSFLLNLSEWDVSNVTSMGSMFEYAGNNATSFTIIGLENWDTSSVTSMGLMFSNAGKKADYTLNLSGWNVCNVTYSLYFDNGVEDKIIEPNWEMSCPVT